MTYIFLDEIQNVASFQKVVDSLYMKDNTDVYITGSNSYLLSSELATLLSGRYVEISMLPLSFHEYVTLTGIPKEDAFAEFMKTGGFPYVSVMNRTTEKIDSTLKVSITLSLLRILKIDKCGKNRMLENEKLQISHY